MALGHVRKYPCEVRKHTWQINSRAMGMWCWCVGASVKWHKRLPLINRSKERSNLRQDVSFGYFFCCCCPSELAIILNSWQVTWAKSLGYWLWTPLILDQVAVSLFLAPKAASSPSGNILFDALKILTVHNIVFLATWIAFLSALSPAVLAPANCHQQEALSYLANQASTNVTTAEKAHKQMVCNIWSGSTAQLAPDISSVSKLANAAASKSPFRSLGGDFLFFFIVVASASVSLWWFALSVMLLWQWTKAFLGICFFCCSSFTLCCALWDKVEVQHCRPLSDYDGGCSCIGQIKINK